VGAAVKPRVKSDCVSMVQNGGILTPFAKRMFSLPLTLMALILTFMNRASYI
jgi:hypothetical protein